jgi:hypothetical protein
MSSDFDQVSEHVKGLKIHAMISGDLDADHDAALRVPLGIHVFILSYAVIFADFSFCIRSSN